MIPLMSKLILELALTVMILESLFLSQVSQTIIDVIHTEIIFIGVREAEKRILERNVDHE